MIWRVFVVTVVVCSVTGAEQGGSSRFSAQTLQQGIISYLKQHIGENDSILFLAPLEDVVFDQSGVVAHCTVPEDRISNRLEVVLSFENNGTLLRTLRIPIKVTLRRYVPVTKRSLQRGHTLQSNDIEYQLRDVTAVASYLPDSLIGTRLAQSLPQGTIVLRSHLLSQGSVRAGELVTLTVHSSGIAIRTTAQALQNATPGALVKVRRNDTGAVLVGTVVGNRSVVVDLTSPSLYHQEQLP